MHGGQPYPPGYKRGARGGEVQGGEKGAGVVGREAPEEPPQGQHHVSIHVSTQLSGRLQLSGAPTLQKLQGPQTRTNPSQARQHYPAGEPLQASPGCEARRVVPQSTFGSEREPDTQNDAPPPPDVRRQFLRAHHRPLLVAFIL